MVKRELVQEVRRGYRLMSHHFWFEWIDLSIRSSIRSSHGCRPIYASSWVLSRCVVGNNMFGTGREERMPVVVAYASSAPAAGQAGTQGGCNAAEATTSNLFEPLERLNIKTSTKFVGR